MSSSSSQGMNMVSAGSTDLFPPARSTGPLPSIDRWPPADLALASASWSVVIRSEHSRWSGRRRDAVRGTQPAGPRARARPDKAEGPRRRTDGTAALGERTEGAETGYMRHCSRASDMIRRIDPWSSRRPFPGHPHHMDPTYV